MIYGVYSVRDLLTGFMAPVVEIDDDVAKRNFEFAVKNADGVLGFRPQDFDLMQIGVFDSETGDLVPCDPSLVLAGISLRGTFDGKDKVD